MHHCPGEVSEQHPMMLTIALTTAATLILSLYVFKRLRRSDTFVSAIFDNLLRLLASSSEQEYRILYDQKLPSKVAKSRSLHPVLVLRDPILIRNVLMRDFEYFTDRPHKRNSRELFDLDGEEWRTARRTLLPVFSPEPLEGMFKYFTANLGTFITRISRELGPPTDIRRAVGICVSDIIALAIFGLEVTIGKRKDEFTDRALSVIETGFFQSIKASLVGPGLSWSTKKYFKGFLRRKLQSCAPNDFVNLMQKMTRENEDGEKRGVCPPDQFYGEEYSDTPLDGKPVQITDELLSDQILQFLSSGFQPIVSAVTFALYDLSVASPDVLAKIRSETTACISKNGGYNYDAVREMSFLDSCVHESLRLHPVVHSITRICVNDYSDEDVRIRRGESVVISILGLHKDERYFTDPDEFCPQRFEDSASKANPFYMPFGRGPRKCVGVHFTLLVIKIILAKLVQQFTFSLSEKSRAKPPHKYLGPYIVPNDIRFHVSFAKPPSILS